MVVVGADVHKRSHTFVAVDAVGRKLGEKTVKATTEGHQVALRADLFNAFNHVQYGLPVLDLANANFGRLNGTSVSYSPRSVQFSLRYVF